MHTRQSLLKICLGCSCIAQVKWFRIQSENMRAFISIIILVLIKYSDATFFHQFTFSSGFWSNRIFQSVQWGKTNLECASICSIINEVNNCYLIWTFFSFHFILGYNYWILIKEILITFFSVSFTYWIRSSRDAILVNFHYQQVWLPLKMFITQWEGSEKVRASRKIIIDQSILSYFYLSLSRSSITISWFSSIKRLSYNNG